MTDSRARLENHDALAGSKKSRASLFGENIELCLLEQSVVVALQLLA